MTFAKLTASLSRRTMLQVSAAAAAMPLSAAAQDATPVASPIASPVGDEPGITGWPSYGRDLTGARAMLDGVITSSNVPALAEIWTADVGGPVSATPIIAGGVAYVGAYDGTLQAIDIGSGSVIWSYQTGSRVMEPNLQIPLGITGSAHFADGVVYVGDASAVVHAIDAVTGEAIWTTEVDTQENASIWSSPVVWDGAVFVGVASVAKEPGFRGSVVALSAATGEPLWQTFMVPEGADGAGVFAVPAIDETRGVLYVGTQNAYSDNDAPYGNPISIVALDVLTGAEVWVFNAPPNDGATAPTDDVGFSASPNLFTATIDGVERDLVGEGQKSGDYWVLDRETGEQVWTTTVSPAGFLGGMEGTSAVANQVIAVPATDWPELGGPASGLVVGLDVVTGQEVWRVTQDAPAASPAAISNDLVFQAGMDGVLHAYGLVDGAELWSSDLGASVSGGVAVADGVVIVAAATPAFAEVVRPGAGLHAFAVRMTAPPEASPEAPPDQPEPPAPPPATPRASPVS